MRAGVRDESQQPQTGTKSLTLEQGTSLACGLSPEDGVAEDASGRLPGGTRPRHLSEEIDGLIEAFAERSVTLREVMAVLRGRAYTLLVILMALPFCTPIPLPGVSTPSGLVIAVIGFRMALGQKPWLPRRLLDTKLPPRFFARLLGAARRIIRGLEVGLRPRWIFLLEAKPLHLAYGAMICVGGLLLLLPLPIPFSNGLPALTIVLIASAILERDGYCLVTGLVMFGLTLCFFGIIFWGGTEAFSWLRDMFRGILEPDDIPFR
jgi:hypothetical protein